MQRIDIMTLMQGLKICYSLSTAITESMCKDGILCQFTMTKTKGQTGTMVDWW